MQVVVGGAVWDDARGSRLDDYLAEARERRIEIGSPLSRLAVIRDEGGEGKAGHIVWTVHHAVYDGWSVQVLDEQLQKAYWSAGSLAPPPPSYSGFVHHVVSRDSEAAKRFWHDRLEGCAAPSTAVYPPLPPNCQPRPTKTVRRTIFIPRCASGGHDKLQATIHAAWALIVSSLTERDDVVFAATLAGRNAANVPGIEQMVGPTIAPVPIRVRLEPSRARPVRSLVDEIESAAAQMVPFKHFGTRNIEAVSADAKAACRLQTLVVVTPADDEKDKGEETVVRTATFEAEDGEDGETDAFHTFALVLFLTPSRGGEMGLD